jgi:hypothetical protein
MEPPTCSSSLATVQLRRRHCQRPSSQDWCSPVLLKKKGLPLGSGLPCVHVQKVFSSDIWDRTCLTSLLELATIQLWMPLWNVFYNLIHNYSVYTALLQVELQPTRNIREPSEPYKLPSKIQAWPCPLKQPVLRY